MHPEVSSATYLGPPAFTEWRFTGDTLWTRSDKEEVSYPFMSPEPLMVADTKYALILYWKEWKEDGENKDEKIKTQNVPPTPSISEIKYLGN